MLKHITIPSLEPRRRNTSPRNRCPHKLNRQQQRRNMQLPAGKMQLPAGNIYREITALKTIQPQESHVVSKQQRVMRWNYLRGASLLKRVREEQISVENPFNRRILTQQDQQSQRHQFYLELLRQEGPPSKTPFKVGFLNRKSQPSPLNSQKGEDIYRRYSQDPYRQNRQSLPIDIKLRQLRLQIPESPCQLSDMSLNKRKGGLKREERRIAVEAIRKRQSQLSGWREQGLKHCLSDVDLQYC